MAIVKFGPTVIGARGTISGTIFSANKAGPFARGWSKGADPHSALQTIQRGRYASISASWRDLTQPQRDDWILYADDPAQELTNSLGETYFASGFNWYVHVNQNLDAADEARRDDAPTLIRSAPPQITISPNFFFITAGSALTRIQMDGGSPNLGFNHVIIARITGQGRSAIAAGFKFQILAVPTGTRVIFFQDEIEATFGTIVLGHRMHAQVTIQDSHGQRSTFAAKHYDAQA